MTANQSRGSSGPGKRLTHLKDGMNTSDKHGHRWTRALKAAPVIGVLVAALAVPASAWAPGQPGCDVCAGKTLVKKSVGVSGLHLRAEKGAVGVDRTTLRSESGVRSLAQLRFVNSKIRGAGPGVNPPNPDEKVRLLSK